MTVLYGRHVRVASVDAPGRSRYEGSSQAQQARSGRPEPAGPVELLEVGLVVNVQPGRARCAGLVSGGHDESPSHPMALPVRMNRRVPQERMGPTIGGHVDEPNEPITRPGRDPDEAALQHPPRPNLP